MATRQEKEQRAEAAARQAADDLRDVDRGRLYDERVVYEEELDQSPQQQQQRPGVFGTVLRAVVDKSHEAEDFTREGTDLAAENTRETKDEAAERAKEYKDNTTVKEK
ncbi:hypothetical protein QUC31_011019 [Theobroma cacao]